MEDTKILSIFTVLTVIFFLLFVWFSIRNINNKRPLLISHINVAESTGNKMYIVYTLIDGVPQPEIMVPHDEALGRLVEYWEDEYELVWLTGAVENNNPPPPVDKL
jgi:hypothetical protein